MSIITHDEADQLGLVNLIYDSYRTMLLNRLYYGRRLENFKSYNLTTEFLIAAGATGSGVAGWTVWQHEYGAATWAVISGLSIVLAIAKPLLKFAERIENYSKLYGEYANAFLSLKMLVGDLQVYRDVSEERLKSFVQIRNRAVELARLDDPNPNKKIIRELQQEVNTQIPIDQLWVPPR